MLWNYSRIMHRYMFYGLCPFMLSADSNKFCISTPMWTLKSQSLHCIAIVDWKRRLTIWSKPKMGRLQYSRLLATPCVWIWPIATTNLLTLWQWAHPILTRKWFYVAKMWDETTAAMSTPCKKIWNRNMCQNSNLQATRSLSNSFGTCCSVPGRVARDWQIVMWTIEEAES